VRAHGGRDAAEQVEDDEPHAAMASLHIVPEDPEYSMFPTRCNGPPCRNMEVTTVMPAGTGPAKPRIAGEQPRRHQGEGLQKGLLSPLAERHLVQGNRDVDRNEQDGDDREAFRGLESLIGITPWLAVRCYRNAPSGGRPAEAAERYKNTG